MKKKAKTKEIVFFSLLILLPLLAGLTIIFLPPALQNQQLSQEAEEEERFYHSLKAVVQNDLLVETPSSAFSKNTPAPSGSPNSAEETLSGKLMLPVISIPVHYDVPVFSGALEEITFEARNPLLFRRQTVPKSSTYPLFPIRKPDVFSSLLARTTSTPAPAAEPKLTKADFDACLRQNSDFIAWLTIPGTNVDYPVVQTNNTDYYLKHTFSGKESSLGTLFSLGKADWKTPGKNIAIFGHAISGSGNKMFRALLQYKDENFFRNHQTIYLDSLYHTGVYTVFAVFDTTVEDFDPSATVFPREEDFRDFIKQAKTLSLYDAGISVPESATVISLITCDRSFKQKIGRFVVMAVKTQ